MTKDIRIFTKRHNQVYNDINWCTYRKITATKLAAAGSRHTDYREEL